MNELPLPPYGRIMQAYQDAKILPESDIYYPSWDIYVGRDAPQIAKLRLKKQDGIACYLPYGHDYQDYYWPISDQNIEIINVGFVTVNFIKKMSIFLSSRYKPKSLIAYGDIWDISEEAFIPSNVIILFKGETNE